MKYKLIEIFKDRQLTEDYGHIKIHNNGEQEIIFDKDSIEANLEFPRSLYTWTDDKKIILNEEKYQAQLTQKNIFKFQKELDNIKQDIEQVELFGLTRNDFVQLKARAVELYFELCKLKGKLPKAEIIKVDISNEL